VLVLASALVVGLALLTFLPLTASVFAYAFVEARSRRRWTGVARPALALGGGPYRAAEMAPARLVRAPWLVRAAALGCFYWSWFCLMAWVGVGVLDSECLAVEPVVVLGVAVAMWLARTGVRLLRRDARVVASGRRVAVGAAVHATLVVVLGFVGGGGDWGAPAAVFGAVSLALATLVASALRAYAPLFALPGTDAAAARRRPAWLARLLARRAQRRANFLASASHTRAGA
jgi:hypothetical protein